MTRTLEEAVEQLKRDPSTPVRAAVDGLTVEVRAVPPVSGMESAADLLAAIGPWAGETTDEILAWLNAARTAGGKRPVSNL